ncbi:MAG TPA: RNA methyltransferase [Ktedonobacterales bacterium]|jgi:TrmH family RNA methyltransferase|nr:RNA methyltransferase [Ktedonobacterales bacterium]
MAMITSPSNQHIALLRSLQTAKGREAEGLFLIEGPHLLVAALDAQATPRLVVYDPATLERTIEGRRLLERVADARAAGAEVYEATAGAVERASDTRTPQGIVAAVALEDVAPDRTRARRRGRARPMLLALDALSDPGNMGTILRSALAADADEALLSPGCADPFAPKVVRAGAGAHFHLPIRAGLAWSEIAQRFAGAPAVNDVLVAEASGQIAYDEIDLAQRVALIIGNEAHGVSREAAKLATKRVSIPMWNKVESLNAGIAASVILFEAARQRRARERTSIEA